MSVFVRYRDGTHLSRIGAWIQTHHGRIQNHFSLMQMLTVQIPYEGILEFERIAGRVYLNRQFSACLDGSVPLIKPSAQWSTIETEFGYSINGTGIRVAVLDTGIEDSHPDLDDLDDNITTSDPKILLQQSFVEGNANPDDDNGHGTHVAGIIGVGENTIAALFALFLSAQRGEPVGSYIFR